MNVPKEQGPFLQTNETGKKEWPDKNRHPKVQRSMKSFAQDLMFGVSREERLSHPNRSLFPML